MIDQPNRLPRRPDRPAQDQTPDRPFDRPDQAGLDVLSDVLRCVRLTSAMLFLVDGCPPWVTQAPAARWLVQAALPGAQHLISYHIVAEGGCWVGLTGAEPQHLSAGDILVIPHGDPYFLADPYRPALPPCNTDESIAFFSRMAAGELPTVVTAGAGSPPRTHFICSFLGCDMRPFNPILAALPPVLCVRRAGHSDEVGGLIRLALRELCDRRSGSREVLLRLSELMFIATVRHYLQAMPEAQR